MKWVNIVTFCIASNVSNKRIFTCRNTRINMKIPIKKNSVKFSLGYTRGVFRTQSKHPRGNFLR